LSLKTRVWKLLGKFDRRVTLVEDTAERIEGAVHDMLEVATELKATAAILSAKARSLDGTAERLERAVREQGKTLATVLDTQKDEGERRAGLGKEIFGRLYVVEQRLGMNGSLK
jgi:hypothetical protein